jgi:hypothetical protein
MNSEKKPNVIARSRSPSVSRPCGEADEGRSRSPDLRHEPLLRSEGATWAVTAAPARLTADLPRFCSPATIRPRDTPAKSVPFLSPSVSGLLDHVGRHASRSMRPRICQKRVLVKWLSASGRVKYRACRMRRPPVLNSRCWRLVRDRLWMATGKTIRRSRLPRL